MCRGLPGDCLGKMRFAVFGLGDSGYAKYNAAARKLHARLLQLGAGELVSTRPTNRLVFLRTKRRDVSKSTVVRHGRVALQVVRRLTPLTKYSSRFA